MKINGNPLFLDLRVTIFLHVNAHISITSISPQTAIWLYEFPWLPVPQMRVTWPPRCTPYSVVHLARRCTPRSVVQLSSRCYGLVMFAVREDHLLRLLLVIGGLLTLLTVHELLSTQDVGVHILWVNVSTRRVSSNMDRVNQPSKPLNCGKRIT